MPPPQTAALVYSSASGRLAVSQSPSGAERPAPPSPHPAEQRRSWWGRAVEASVGERARITLPPREDLSLVTRAAFKASSRVYPQPHVSLQFD